MNLEMLETFSYEQVTHQVNTLQIIIERMSSEIGFFSDQNFAGTQIDILPEISNYYAFFVF